MNLQEAKNLKQGDIIYHKTRVNADKTPMRAKITSIKRWKRDPDRIEIRYKRGLREFGILTNQDLDEITY